MVPVRDREVVGTGGEDDVTARRPDGLVHGHDGQLVVRHAFHVGAIELPRVGGEGHLLPRGRHLTVAHLLEMLMGTTQQCVIQLREGHEAGVHLTLRGVPPTRGTSAPTAAGGSHHGQDQKSDESDGPSQALHAESSTVPEPRMRKPDS